MRCWTSVLLLAGCAILATLPAWRDLLYIGWQDEEASQVLLAPFAAIWLAWLRRDAMRHQPWHTSWLGAAILLAAAGLYVLGDQMLWQAFWHLSAPLALVGVLVTVFGVRCLIALAPAAAVLAFMAPVPGRVRQAISLPLQEWTAIGGQRIFDLLGVYVERNGNMLVVDGTAVEVQEACNGLRLIFALTLVCYVYAFSVPMKPWARVALIIGSPLLAVVLNTIRLVPTAWMYAHAAPERAQMFHDTTGWVMLPIALGCLILIGWIIGWIRGRNAATNVGPSPDAEPALLADEAAEPSPDAESVGLVTWPGSWWPIVLAAPLLLLIPLADFSARPDWPEPDAYHAHVAEVAEALPYRIEGWIGADSDPPPAVGDLLRPNVMLSRTYRHLDTGQLASILLVQSRDARDLAGHYPPVCYPAHGWEPTGEAAFNLSLEGQSAPMTRYSFYRDEHETIPAIAVYDLFALPGVGLTPDMTALRRQGERRYTRAYGAAHWMIVFPASMPAEDQAETAGQFTSAALPILQAVVDVRAADQAPAAPSPQADNAP